MNVQTYGCVPEKPSPSQSTRHRPNGPPRPLELHRSSGKSLPRRHPPGTLSPRRSWRSWTPDPQRSCPLAAIVEGDAAVAGKDGHRVAHAVVPGRDAPRVGDWTGHAQPLCPTLARHLEARSPASKSEVIVVVRASDFRIEGGIDAIARAQDQNSMLATPSSDAALQTRFALKARLS